MTISEGDEEDEQPEAQVEEAKDEPRPFRRADELYEFVESSDSRSSSGNDSTF